MSDTYTDEGELIVLVAVSVTCPTAGCENQGITLELEIPEGGAVMCGPCGATLEAVAR